MKEQEVFDKIDYTLLSPTLPITKYKRFCEEAESRGIKYICVPPIYVNKLKYLYPDLSVSTILDFPYGFLNMEDKIHTIQNLKADEFSIVLNYNNIKSNKWITINQELSDLRESTDKILKVHINTNYLSGTEKELLAKSLSKYHIDFIELYNKKKVSLEDIETFKNNTNVKIIDANTSITEIENVLNLGVNRIGLYDISQLIDDIKIYTRKKNNI